MKLTQSLVAIAALSTLSFAGGDINPITVFEQEAVVVPITPVPVAAPAPTPAPIVVAPPAVVVPVVAAAPLGLYIAGGLTNIAVRKGDRANLFAEETAQDRQLGFTGRLGYDFMDYLGAELRGTYGFNSVAPFATKFKQVGAYLKPNYDLTDELNLYGLVGASKTNGAGTGTTTGLSYGAGIDYGITDDISVFSDLLNYSTKKVASQWGLTLGAAYQF